MSFLLDLKSVFSAVGILGILHVIVFVVGPLVLEGLFKHLH